MWKSLHFTQPMRKVNKLEAAISIPGGGALVTPLSMVEYGGLLYVVAYSSTEFGGTDYARIITFDSSGHATSLQSASFSGTFSGYRVIDVYGGYLYVVVAGSTAGVSNIVYKFDPSDLSVVDSYDVSAHMATNTISGGRFVNPSNGHFLLPNFDNAQSAGNKIRIREFTNTGSYVREFCADNFSGFTTGTVRSTIASLAFKSDGSEVYVCTVSDVQYNAATGYDHFYVQVFDSSGAFVRRIAVEYWSVSLGVVGSITGGIGARPGDYYSSELYLHCSGGCAVINPTTGALSRSFAHSTAGRSSLHISSGGDVWTNDVTAYKKLYKVSTSGVAALSFDCLTYVSGGGGAYSQTEWFHKNQAGLSITMGTPDGGVNIPPLDAIRIGDPNEDLKTNPAYYLQQLRSALERIVRNGTIQNPKTGAPFNFNAGDSTNNVYYVAMHSQERDYGLAGQTLYTWTRPIADNETKFYDVDIGELWRVIETLYDAADQQGLV